MPLKRGFFLFFLIISISAAFPSGKSEAFSDIQPAPSLLAAKKEKGKKAPKSAKKNGKNEIAATYEGEPEEEQGPVTTIKIDKTKSKSTYFSGVDDSVVEDVELGSIESLTRAVSRLRHSGVDLKENEKVLLNIAWAFLKYVWTSATPDWDPPAVDAKNPYMGALDSARSGIYDTSTGNVDFLATVMPSIVLCMSQSRSDYYDRCEADLNEAVSMRPNSSIANYFLAMLDIRKKSYSSALDAINAAIRHDSSVEAAYRRAEILFYLARYDEVTAACDVLLIQHPDYIPLLKLCARNSLALSDYVSAERYASLVLQQNPSDLEFVLFRARVFVSTGEYLKAASLLDVYARTNSNSREYLLLRARLQKEWNKNLTAAVSTIDKAMALFPDDTEVVLYAAELSSETGAAVNGKSGSELARKILEKEPGNTLALSFLIKTLVKEQRWKEAYDVSSRLMAQGSPSIEASCNHIKICLSTGNYDEAWKIASALYEKNQSEERSVQAYIQVLVATARTAQASRLINALLPSASSSMKSFLYYQRSFISSGENAQLADLRSSLIANPRNSDALFRMYSIYFEKKDYRKAQYYLRQVVALNANDPYYLRLSSELDTLLR